MKLSKHQRTKHGPYRRERADSSMKKLKEEYVELNNLRGKAGRARTLGGAREAAGVVSLDQLRKKARKVGKKQ